MSLPLWYQVCMSARRHSALMIADPCVISHTPGPDDIWHLTDRWLRKVTANSCTDIGLLVAHALQRAKSPGAGRLVFVLKPSEVSSVSGWTQDGAYQAASPLL
ncbi:unnamed protein product [Pleuronectes platessa]|uniref:Uncharacterized protein n=1 Tax=Pleuronectes platessa TaxID=8262 RepID=A0A9N7VV98_PLEPL|nr:unnamed protein product [Pleuronectes platessa]